MEIEQLRQRGRGWYKIAVPIDADWYPLKQWCLDHIGKEEGDDPLGRWFADISDDRWQGNTEPHVFYFENESDAKAFAQPPPIHGHKNP